MTTLTITKKGITIMKEGEPPRHLTPRESLALTIRAVRREYRNARRINPSAYAHIPPGFADRETICKLFGIAKSTVTKMEKEYDIDSMYTTTTRNTLGRDKHTKVKAWSFNEFSRAVIRKKIHSLYQL